MSEKDNISLNQILYPLEKVHHHLVFMLKEKEE